MNLTVFIAMSAIAGLGSAITAVVAYIVERRLRQHRDRSAKVTVQTDGERETFTVPVEKIPEIRSMKEPKEDPNQLALV